MTTIKMPAKKPAPPSPEEFIAGATAAPQPASAPAQDLPWLNPRIRDDLRVQFNTKIPERLAVQVNWLATRMGMSKQEIDEAALRAWVQAELQKLGLPE